MDLSSLDKAVSSLTSAVEVSQSENFMRGLNAAQTDLVRAGVIQKFEFSYELCWKFIQRWLKENVSVSESEPRTRKDLFRLAARHALIDDPSRWFGYTRARNITAHTYDPEKAREVFDIAMKFLPDARFLLERLEQAND